MYSKKVCPYCTQAKNLLNSKGIPFTEINVEDDALGRTYLVEQNLRSVPQIFHNEKRIGGFNELKTWLELKEQTL